ncbi:lipoprotein, partial [Helicobacter pylori]
MKKILLAVVAALILGGCSYSTFQYKASCKV